MSGKGFRTRYTVDAGGRVREYADREAWEFIGRHAKGERPVPKKELPRGFEVYRTFGFQDV